VVRTADTAAKGIREKESKMSEDFEGHKHGGTRHANDTSEGEDFEGHKHGGTRH
jgi:hypothetical protein